MLVAHSKPFPRHTAQKTVHSLAVLDTAWGKCGVVWENHESENEASFAERPAGALLCRIYLPGHSLLELRHTVLQAFPNCHEVLCSPGRAFHPETVPEWFGELARNLYVYFTSNVGPRAQQFVDNWAYWRTRLDWAPLTPFQRRVLEVVATIPSGTSLTYGQVARRAGNPAAARAVGMAMRHNPWPVLVPCHRVLGAGGKLTGFSAPGGIQTKQKMLQMEAG